VLWITDDPMDFWSLFMDIETVIIKQIKSNKEYFGGVKKI